MKRLSAGLLAGLLFSGMGGMAEATVLTFDDIQFPGDSGNMPESYGGLTWDSSWHVFDGDLWSPGGGQGFEFGAVSGKQTAYNFRGYDVTISNDEDFIFTGAYLTSATTRNLHIRVTGKKDDVTLYNRTVKAPLPQIQEEDFYPTWFQFDYSGIDELQFAAFGGTPGKDVYGDPYPRKGTTFVMDNFTFSAPEPVPEPATVFLFGTGLAGLAVSRIRGKRK